MAEAADPDADGTVHVFNSLAEARSRCEVDGSLLLVVVGPGVDSLVARTVDAMEVEGSVPGVPCCSIADLTSPETAEEQREVRRLYDLVDGTPAAVVLAPDGTLLGKDLPLAPMDLAASIGRCQLEWPVLRERALALLGGGRQLRELIGFLHDRYRWDECATACHTLLDVEPDAVDIHECLVECLLHLDQVEEAEAATFYLLRRFPNHPRALYWRLSRATMRMDPGRALSHQMNTKEGVDSADRLQKLVNEVVSAGSIIDEQWLRAKLAGRLSPTPATSVSHWEWLAARAVTGELMATAIVNLASAYSQVDPSYARDLAARLRAAYPRDWRVDRALAGFDLTQHVRGAGHLPFVASIRFEPDVPQVGDTLYVTVLVQNPAGGHEAEVEVALEFQGVSVEAKTRLSSAVHLERSESVELKHSVRVLSAGTLEVLCTARVPWSELPRVMWRRTAVRAGSEER